MMALGMNGELTQIRLNRTSILREGTQRFSFQRLRLKLYEINQ